MDEDSPIIDDLRRRAQKAQEENSEAVLRARRWKELAEEAMTLAGEMQVLLATTTTIEMAEIRSRMRTLRQKWVKWVHE